VLASSRKHTRERKRRLKIRKKGERKKSANQERTKHGKRETSDMSKLHEGLSGLSSRRSSGNPKVVQDLQRH
jgi:hypothetical protein